MSISVERARTRRPITWLTILGVILLPAVIGGILVLAADTFARTIASPLELPAGAVTALIGAPLFLLLILRRQVRNG